MFWEVLWALVLGFAVSGCLQVFVSKARMQREFGPTNFRTVGLAILFGAASSSCSFAAAAAARTAFRKGAGFVPAVAFMFASTNLVFELGAILWLLMGWRFVAAEFVGAFVLIAVMWPLAALTLPKRLVEEARAHTQKAEAASDHCGHDQSAEGDETPSWRTRDAWSRVGRAFLMDWQMVARDIVIGFLVAGYLAALVPDAFWNRLFLTGHPGPVQAVENAIVGPLVAAASFVCSIGNVPLAGVLWSGGISFGGVIAFIYADLITIPLLVIYVRYYGKRMAVYLTIVLFVSMAASGLVVDGLFSLLGWIPKNHRLAAPISHPRFSWNYTSGLDLCALALAGLLLWLSRRPSQASSHGCCSD
jgi:uncharacterized membrane protein YraQ (UPF0718 family)